MEIKFIENTWISVKIKNMMSSRDRILRQNNKSNDPHLWNAYKLAAVQAKPDI